MVPMLVGLTISDFGTLKKKKKVSKFDCIFRFFIETYSNRCIVSITLGNLLGMGHELGALTKDLTIVRV
jgi:hypothetical protein